MEVVTSSAHVSSQRRNATVLLVLLAAGVSFAIGRAMGTGSSPYWLVLVAGVSLVAACSRWPGLFIGLYLSYALFYSLLPSIQLTLAGMSVYADDLFKLLGIALVALWALRRRRVEWPRSSLMLPLMVFLLLAGLDAAVGLLNGYALRNVLRDASAVLGYAMVLVGYTFVRDRRTIQRWAYLFVIVGTLAAAYAIGMRALGIEAAAGFAGSAAANTSFGEVVRAFGLSGATAFYLLAFFITLTALIQRTRLWIGSSRVALWAVNILCLVQILLLFGRSLFLGLVAGIALVAVTSPTRLRLTLALAGGATAIALFVIAPAVKVPFAAQAANRYLSIVATSAAGEAAETTTEARQLELRQVWAALEPARRIVGRGLGVSAGLTDLWGHELIAYHNSLAEMILKMGLAGVAIYVWLLAQTMRETIQGFRAPGDPQMQALYLALMATFVGIAVWGVGTMGMPFRANPIACLALGMALRCREVSLLGGQKEGRPREYLR